MRYLVGFIFVLALGVMPMVGCSETSGEGGSGGDGGSGGTAGDGGSGGTAGDGGSGGTAGVGGSGGTAGSGGTGGTDQCEGAEDGTTCSDGACLDGACTVLTTVSGSVTVQESLDVDSPAVGATVSVRGTSLSTTPDEFGEFSFDVFAGGWFFESSKEDTWGVIELYFVPTGGRSDLEIVVAADAYMAQIEQTLVVDIDDTKGMVLLFFESPGGSGGETATLSESYDLSFTFDADGEPVLSDDVLPGDELPALVFGGVDLTEELFVTPVGVDGENTCDLEYPGAVYPVMAKVITVVDAVCAPVR
jgi:hypothetical protein